MEATSGARSSGGRNQTHGFSQLGDCVVSLLNMFLAEVLPAVELSNNVLISYDRVRETVD